MCNNRFGCVRDKDIQKTEILSVPEPVVSCEERQARRAQKQADYQKKVDENSANTDKLIKRGVPNRA